MKWYDKEIYCTRGETFTIDFSIINRDGTPYRISTELRNAFFLLRVKSDAYSQKNRYVFENYTNLADFPKVDDMFIEDVTVLPSGSALIRNKLLRLSTDGQYYLYDDVQNKYVKYGMEYIYTFTSDITKDWIDKTYTYELQLVSGSLKSDYVKYLESGKVSDYLDSPFEQIEHVFEVIPKTKIYVDDN